MLNRSVIDWPHGVSVYKPEKCYNGFTLVHGRGNWDPAHGVAAKNVNKWHLIDMKGRVVHQWYGDPIAKGPAQLLERVANGNYVSNGERVSEQDWEGNTVWSLERLEGRGGFHHDVQKLVNGNYLVAASKRVDSPAISREPIEDGGFIEVTPDREIVWEWSALDHFDEFGFSDETRRIIHETGGGQHWPRDKGGWLHQNTVFALPENPHFADGDDRFKPGNLLTSSRCCNMLFIIERPSGRIVWKWGHLPRMRGSKMWLDGVDEEERRAVVGPHDVKMLHNGNIMCFDNGGCGGYPPVVRFYTRLVELNPVSGEIVWEYVFRPHAVKYLSIVTGSAQRLPNGNTVSLHTDTGRVFEITPQGEIVWEYINPRGGFYRTQRIAYEDCPQADPFFAETDGHAGVATVRSTIPDNLGLPVQNTPDYCPPFQ